MFIHGKHNHEETRATFSHSKTNAPAIIIQNMEEAKVLAAFITGDRAIEEFEQVFAGRYSEDFDPQKDLERIGVVNQTTILATETQAISDYLQEVIVAKYNEDAFADTRDTLCYATLDNQKAVTEMLAKAADMAIVVGGYNSSNTSHLVELCEEKLKTFYILLFRQNIE